MPMETEDFSREEYADKFGVFEGRLEDERSVEMLSEEEAPEGSESASEDGEADTLEPGMSAVLEHKGGEATDWQKRESGESGYWFDGVEIRDAAGNSWTKEIEATQSPEEIALHREMLAQWREGGNAVFFLPDYIEKTPEGDVLYVTQVYLGEDGKVGYEIWATRLGLSKEEDEFLAPPEAGEIAVEDAAPAFESVPEVSEISFAEPPAEHEFSEKAEATLKEPAEKNQEVTAQEAPESAQDVTVEESGAMPEEKETPPLATFLRQIFKDDLLSMPEEEGLAHVAEQPVAENTENLREDAVLVAQEEEKSERSFEASRESSQKEIREVPAHYQKATPNRGEATEALKTSAARTEMLRMRIDDPRAKPEASDKVLPVPRKALKEGPIVFSLSNEAGGEKEEVVRPEYAVSVPIPVVPRAEEREKTSAIVPEAARASAMHRPKESVPNASGETRSAEAKEPRSNEKKGTPIEKRASAKAPRRVREYPIAETSRRERLFAPRASEALLRMLAARAFPRREREARVSVTEAAHVPGSGISRSAPGQKSIAPRQIVNKLNGILMSRGA